MKEGAEYGTGTEAGKRLREGRYSERIAKEA